MKLYYGPFISNETKEEEDLIIKCNLPNKVKELLIGGSLIAIGHLYLAFKAFKNGADSYEKSEFEVLKKIGCIK